MIAFVGCYTTADRNGRGDGVNVFRVDPESGLWTHVQLLAHLANPSYLTLDPRHRTLYSVHGGALEDVSAFAIDQATGRLALLNTRRSGGQNPVSLTVHPGRRYLAVANYGAGSVAVLPVEADGSLEPFVDRVETTGDHGPHPVEQAGPHPHDIVFDRAGAFLAVPDKGLDRVFVYRLDTERGKLLPADPPWAQARPGAAPRHVAFHPNGRYAYVINELDSTITAYGYQADRGTLHALQVVSTLPSGFAGTTTGAEIAVHPSGRFVYGSNRGHDSIAVFAVDGGSGELTAVDWTPTGGRTPRTFALDPSGKALYAANQDSDTIIGFAVDQATGRLAPTGQVVQTGSPSAIVFAPLAGS